MNKYYTQLILIFIFALLLTAPAAYGANNPFLSPKNEQSSPARHRAAPAKTELQQNIFGSTYSLIMANITSLQKEIRDRLTGFARDIKKSLRKVPVALHGLFLRIRSGPCSGAGAR